MMVQCGLAYRTLRGLLQSLKIYEVNMTVFDKLNKLLAQQKKSIFSSFELKNMMFSEYNIKKSSVIPSDYCYNRTNHGIGRGNKILLFLGSSEYQYLGENYEYNGWVYHKEQHSTEEKIVGEWRNGTYIPYDEPIYCEVIGEKADEIALDGGIIPAKQIEGLSLEHIEDLYAKYLSILELEVSILGCAPTETRHLIGRIGEFKCALETRGTLSSVANQHGFDVICGAGKRISVKTTAQTSGFVSINKNTLDKVDELMIIQYKSKKFTVIFHGLIAEAIKHAKPYGNKFELGISKAINLNKLT